MQNPILSVLPRALMLCAQEVQQQAFAMGRLAALTDGLVLAGLVAEGAEGALDLHCLPDLQAVQGNTDLVLWVRRAHAMAARVRLHMP